jgi:hypothetical protein
LIAKGVGIEELLDTHPPMTALMWTAQEGHDSLAKKLILQGVIISLNLVLMFLNSSLMHIFVEGLSCTHSAVGV